MGFGEAPACGPGREGSEECLSIANILYFPGETARDNWLYYLVLRFVISLLTDPKVPIRAFSSPSSKKVLSISVL